MLKWHGMCRYPASAEALKQMDVLCSQIAPAVRPPQPLSGLCVVQARGQLA